MNHVPLHQLRQVRWTLVIYNVLLLGAFAAYTIIFNHPHAFEHFGMIILIVVVLQVVYEVLNSTLLFKDSYSPKTWLSLVFALIQTFIIVQATGVYSSPFIIGAFILIFIAEALSPFIGLTLVAIGLVSLMIGYSGLINQPINMLANGVYVIASLIATGTGYWFWRSRYLNKPSSVDDLSSSLSTEQAKSEIILNGIEDGVMLLDNQGVIRTFNPGAVAITGWPSSDAVGLDYRSVIKLVDEKGQPYTEEKNPFHRILTEKKTIRDNVAVLMTQSGKQVAVDISASPLLTRDGTVIGAVGVFRDVTEERNQEKQGADFVSTASHEMRTPVAAIEGYLALALNPRVSNIDERARDYITKAHTTTQHLGKLFQDLLTTTRAEDGRLVNRPSVVEMGSFLEKIAEDLRFTAEKKGLQMEFVMGSHEQPTNKGSQGGIKVIKPLYYAYIDPERIREVITNLFDNAVKYTLAGTVSIGLTGDNEIIQISVNDTGPGIPTEDIPHLFQKFYRVDNSTTRTVGGTGLGLFICKKIVELYDGRIWVESEFGNGSTFYINLPRMSALQAKEQQEKDQAAAQALASQTSTPAPTPAVIPAITQQPEAATEAAPTVPTTSAS